MAKIKTLKMVLDQDLKKMALDREFRRVTDINTYEATCWPSFALEIFHAYSDGVTCYTCDCIMLLDKCYVFWHQKVGGRTKDITSPSLQKVGDMLSPTF